MRFRAVALRPFVDSLACDKVVLSNRPLTAWTAISFDPIQASIGVIHASNSSALALALALRRDSLTHVNTCICYFCVFRIDGIHQQLEEELSVVAQFIDGVANLRPKGTLVCLVL